MDNKFTEAALIKIENRNKQIINDYVRLADLAKLRKDYDNSISKEYAETYKNHLFCPFCKGPQLSLVRSSKTGKYFLKTYSKQVHKQDCSYKFKSVKSELVDKLLINLDNNPANCKLVNSKLQSLIYKLKTNNDSLQPFLVKVSKSQILSDDINDKAVKTKRNIRRLPIKSLSSPINENDMNTAKFFYGEVNAHVDQRASKSKGNIFYAITINSITTNNYLCSIEMNKAIYDNLNIPDKLHNTISNKQNVPILIAFATILNPDKTNRFIDGNIKNVSQCIIIL